MKFVVQTFFRIRLYSISFSCKIANHIRFKHLQKQLVNATFKNEQEVSKIITSVSDTWKTNITFQETNRQYLIRGRNMALRSNLMKFKMKMNVLKNVAE